MSVGPGNLRRSSLKGSQSMCATAALHPDRVRACLGYTATLESDTEGPTALAEYDVPSLGSSLST